MDYEKAYKDALERAKQFSEHPLQEDSGTIVEYIFPELKAEDERIKKCLLKYFENRGPNGVIWDKIGISRENVLAWLEKQGETFTKKDVDDAYIEGMALAKHELEKQSKQKETLCDKCKKAQPSHSCQDITALGRCYIEGINKSNKVEPKFKVGDWIVNKGHSYLIADIDYLEHRYLFEIGGYTHEQLNWEYIELADKRYHLWTLEDAKDGDVLYFNDNTIVIFKDLYNTTTFHSYCHIEDGVFDISKDDMPDWWEGKGFYPATKEQRDLLFQKMKEEGYVWDVEKKKLNKIEQKPAWSEEDETGWTNTMIMIKEVASKHYTKDSIKLVIDWLESIKQRIGG